METSGSRMMFHILIIYHLFFTLVHTCSKVVHQALTFGLVVWLILLDECVVKRLDSVSLH